MAKEIHPDGSVTPIGQDAYPPGTQPRPIISPSGWANILQRSYPGLYNVVCELARANESKGDIMARVKAATQKYGANSPQIEHAISQTIDYIRQPKPKGDPS